MGCSTAQREVMIILVCLLVGGGKAVQFCNFPETVSEVQTDGSEICVCDTTRDFCGQREDLCSKRVCDGNKILINSCECVCPQNYSETMYGKCIAVKPLRCKDGEVVLPDGRCGLSTTAGSTFPTTASPTVQQNPPEVKAVNITSNSATLAVHASLQGGHVRSGIIAVRLYSPRNESLLRQLEQDIEPQHNFTEIDLQGLTPNTTYTVAVRTFTYHAQASAAAVIQLHTSPLVDKDSLLPVPDPDTDSSYLYLYIIVGIAAGLAVTYLAAPLLVYLVCRRRNNNTLGNPRARPDPESLSVSVSSVNDSEERCVDENTHLMEPPDGKSVAKDSDFKEQPNNMPGSNLYPPLPESQQNTSDETTQKEVDNEPASSVHVPEQDDGDNEDTYRKECIDDGCSCGDTGGTIAQPNTNVGINKRVPSNQFDSHTIQYAQPRQESTTDRSQPRHDNTHNHDDIHIPQPREYVSIRSIQRFGETQPDISGGSSRRK